MTQLIFVISKISGQIKIKVNETLLNQMGGENNEKPSEECSA